MNARLYMFIAALARLFTRHLYPIIQVSGHFNGRDAVALMARQHHFFMYLVDVMQT